jgi:hypothetical protein
MSSAKTGATLHWSWATEETAKVSYQIFTDLDDLKVKLYLNVWKYLQKSNKSAVDITYLNLDVFFSELLILAGVPYYRATEKPKANYDAIRVLWDGRVRYIITVEDGSFGYADLLDLSKL